MSDIIWLCPDKFFSPKLQDLDLFGRPGLFIHEQSHRPPVSSGDAGIITAYVDGHALAMDPDLATKTADSYQFFALDNSFAAGGCAIGGTRQAGSGVCWLAVLAGLLLGSRWRRISSLGCGCVAPIVIVALWAAGCAHQQTAVQESACPEQHLRGEVSAALVCGLSVSPSDAAPGAPVMVQMTIYNRSAHDWQVAVVNTPLSEGVRTSTNAYTIKRDGKPVGYRGGFFCGDREPFPVRAYRTVPAGGSVSGTFDLSRDYDLREPGNYEIGWDRDLLDVRPAGDPLPVPAMQRQRARMICTPATLTIRPPA